MAKILWLRDNIHRQAQSVLPWYVTGRLDETERAMVEDHVVNCAACREDLEAERELAMLVAGSSSKRDDHAYEAGPRLRVRPPPRRRRSRWQGAAKAIRTGPTWSGWVVAGSAVAASLIAIAVVPLFVRADYHALSSPAAEAPGNVIVIFRPDTSEREFRSTLAASRARLVDGPTASGAYVLRVPQADRAAILGRLQAHDNVVLAQPLDAEPAR